MFKKASTEDISYINKVLEEFKQPQISNITSEYIIYDDNIGIINYNIVEKEAEIYYLYVEKEYRNNSIGGNLLKEMIDDCIKRECTDIFLEVRESNIAAINLYKKYGFTEISKRLNYYNNPKENAIILNKKLGD